MLKNIVLVSYKTLTAVEQIFANLVKRRSNLIIFTFNELSNFT